MTRLLTGERIGKQGEIRFGCSAAIFSSNRQKILLTRLADNGTWYLPSGGMEPGESISETCQREAIMEHHRERIRNAFADSREVYIR